MKKLIFPTLLAVALVSTSCSNDEGVTGAADSNLSCIELGGANHVKTRAGFTEAKTTLKVHYVSTKDGASTLYMTSSATAAIDTKGGVDDVSTVSQSDDQKRYWEDIHAKDSKLSLYSIAVPNKTSITKNATAFNAWDTSVKKGTSGTLAHTIAWEVSTSQTLETIADEDLAYSNNVSGDNTLGFSEGKFQKGNLVFNHALSRITINLKKGAGFGDISETVFKPTSILFSGFKVSGSLDVETGVITPTGDATSVQTVDSQADLKDNEDNKLGYTYVAQVFPGTPLEGVATTMLSIVVDGNTYNITGDQIYQALKAITSNAEDDIAALKPGTNYNLTIIIKKTGIEIASAKLVDWEKIEGDEMTPSNAIALTVDMEKTAGEKNTSIASDLYRSTSLSTGYTTTGNQNTLSYNSEQSKFVTGTTWYWPDNNTSYYFRTISPQGTAVATATNDNITMEGGAIADANDFIWGAPLEEKHDGTEHKFNYNNGYGDYLYLAIGPTESQIHITQFHMMSNIEVNLTTSDGDDKVDLSDAKVEILNYFNTATLALSNAAITLSGSKTVTSGAITTTDHLKHTWRVIPQTTSGITLKITAAGNVYNVVLPSNTNINDWLPGKSYVYNFKLLKTAIKITSAQLVDWEKVTAADKTVTIE